MMEEEERMYWEERRRYEEEVEYFEWYRRYGRDPRGLPPPPPRPFGPGVPPLMVSFSLYVRELWSGRQMPVSFVALYLLCKFMRNLV